MIPFPPPLSSLTVSYLAHHWDDTPRTSPLTEIFKHYYAHALQETAYPLLCGKRWVTSSKEQTFKKEIDLVIHMCRDITIVHHQLLHIGHKLSQHMHTKRSMQAENLFTFAFIKMVKLLPIYAAIDYGISREKGDVWNIPPHDPYPALTLRENLVHYGCKNAKLPISLIYFRQAWRSPLDMYIEFFEKQKLTEICSKFIQCLYVDSSRLMDDLHLPAHPYEPNHLMLPPILSTKRSYDCSTRLLSIAWRTAGFAILCAYWTLRLPVDFFRFVEILHICHVPITLTLSLGMSTVFLRETCLRLNILPRPTPEYENTMTPLLGTALITSLIISFSIIIYLTTQRSLFDRILLPVENLPGHFWRVLKSLHPSLMRVKNCIKILAEVDDPTNVIHYWKQAPEARVRLSKHLASLN